MVHSPHGGRLRGVPRPSQQSAAPRPALPAEAAQARLFEDILRSEIAEMLTGPPQSRATMQARVAELDRLIQALRHRFPHSAKPATPLRPGMHPTAERAPRALLN